MYESRAKGSKPSLQTRVWLFFIKIFSCWNTPRLYSYQGSLPRLPLPDVHDTMTRVSYSLINNSTVDFKYVLSYDMMKQLMHYLKTIIIVELKNYYCSIEAEISKFLAKIQKSLPLNF